MIEQESHRNSFRPAALRSARLRMIVAKTPADKPLFIESLRRKRRLPTTVTD
jgi:hypothetical protein